MLTGSAHSRLLSLFLSFSYVDSYIYKDEICLSDNPKRFQMHVNNKLHRSRLTITNENTACVPYHITQQSTVEIFMTKGFTQTRNILVVKFTLRIPRPHIEICEFAEVNP